MIVYRLSSDGGEYESYYPTKAEALSEARQAKADGIGGRLTACEVGVPLNRAGVCRLLQGTSWARRQTVIMEWEGSDG